MKFWKDAFAAPGQSQAVDFTDTPANELEWSEWYDIIYHFNVELVTFAILMIFVCYILLRTPAKFFVKFITIPLLFFLFYSTIYKLNDILGYAYPVIPVGKVILLDGLKNGQTIEIWVKHLGERDTRLYKLPWTKELQKKLKQARKAREMGNPLVIEWKKLKGRKGHKGEHRNPGQFIVYTFRELTKGPGKNYENSND